MKRRTLLRWLCQAIATCCTAIVAFPAIQFVIAPLKKKKRGESASRRVAQLDQLKIGQPQEFPVIGNRRDAWTVYSNEAIGRVWLVRRTEDENVEPGKVQIDAYSSVCPHLRCAVQMASDKKKFTCPCHNAAFDFNGEAFSKEKLGRNNPSPRGMDLLESSIVQDEKTKIWWVEVKFQKFKTGIAEKVVET